MPWPSPPLRLVSLAIHSEHEDSVCNRVRPPNRLPDPRLGLIDGRASSNGQPIAVDIEEEIRSLPNGIRDRVPGMAEISVWIGLAAHLHEADATGSGHSFGIIRRHPEPG